VTLRIAPTGAVAAATAAYAAIFIVLGSDRYATFHSGADLGLFTQTIASAFHGFSNTVEGTSHFAYHFSPILYLCAPLLWLTQSAVSLVVVQAMATALVAPALYAIARRHTSDTGAAVVACIALLYPPLQGVTFTDFHETAFLPATIAWLLWALDARRYAVAIVLVAVALATKEDQGPAMAFLGVVACVYFARRGERAGMSFGVAAIVLSALTFVGYFLLVRPLAGAHSAWVPSHFYAWNVYVPRALPAEIFGRLTYLIEAFLPLALIPLRTPLVLLALPGFAEVLGSRESLTYTMGQHYAAAWVPYVLVAFAVAGAQLWTRGTKAAHRWVVASALLCAVTLVFFSPLHLGHFLRAPNDADAATNAVIARLPRDAAIGTYDEIYAHLGFYPRAAIGVRFEPHYVVYDERYASATWNGIILPKVRRALASGTYRIAASQNGIVLLERSNPR
jgi:uncharacterized membrane protein